MNDLYWAIIYFLAFVQGTLVGDYFGQQFYDCTVEGQGTEEVRPGEEEPYDYLIPYEIPEAPNPFPEEEDNLEV